MDEITRKLAFLAVWGGVFLWSAVGGLAGVGIGRLGAALWLNKKPEKVPFGSGGAIEVNISKRILVWAVTGFVGVIGLGFAFWLFHRAVQIMGYL